MDTVDERNLSLQGGTHLVAFSSDQPWENADLGGMMGSSRGDVIDQCLFNRNVQIQRKADDC